MPYSTRSRLIASLLAVVFLCGTVSLFIGGQLLYQTVLNEATNRIRLDLNAAREIYLTRIKTIKNPLSITALEPSFIKAVEKNSINVLTARLKNIATHSELDFIGITSNQNLSVCRIAGSVVHTEQVSIDNPLADAVLERLVPVSGTAVLHRSFLTAHSIHLAERARIEFIPTPMSVPRSEHEETSGMVLAAAVPVFGAGGLVGVLYGGFLLNRSTEIVDRVRDTVFRQEIYNGRSIGTATIFFNDLRISTNVFTPDAKRAVGTIVSDEVKEDVLVQGNKWTGRAFVVSDWYITAYEPLEDIFGNRVGMLYVGLLEAKYADIRRRLITIFVLITFGGMILAAVLGYLLADRMLRPVNRLIKASRQVSEGDLNPDLGPLSSSEMGVLQKTFSEMLASLRARELRSRAESENRLLQSERQASIGRLAAGVAHEINNPLTGVLTYTHMLLKRKDLDDQVRSELTVIANATERVRKIVKGLLDFSRQTKIDPEPTDVNRLLKSTIAMIENQALLKGIGVKLHEAEHLPTLTVDRSQLQSVLLNMLINAIDATDTGGSINVYTATGLSGEGVGQRGVEITIADTGCGIVSENLDKLFDPFFTTKEVGQGTGLGLSVSLGIIQRHGGTIRVQSEAGTGTRFFIWLPIDREV